MLFLLSSETDVFTRFPIQVAKFTVGKELMKKKNRVGNLREIITIVRKGQRAKRGRGEKRNRAGG